MIDRISMTNFKCFEALDLDLAPLTLLTGFNAGGKSTATQTLLLLEQTLRGPRNSPCLLLNGPVVSLRHPSDVPECETVDRSRCRLGRHRVRTRRGGISRCRTGTVVYCRLHTPR